jgi:hypothetical protein
MVDGYPLGVFGRASGVKDFQHLTATTYFPLRLLEGRMEKFPKGYDPFLFNFAVGDPVKAKTNDSLPPGQHVSEIGDDDFVQNVSLL